MMALLAVSGLAALSVLLLPSGSDGRRRLCLFGRPMATRQETWTWLGIRKDQFMSLTKKKQFAHRRDCWEALYGKPMESQGSLNWDAILYIGCGLYAMSWLLPWLGFFPESPAASQNNSANAVVGVADTNFGSTQP